MTDEPNATAPGGQGGVAQGGAGEGGPMRLAELNILESIAWGVKHFGSLTTNRQVRRRDVLRAVDRGFAESIGEVEMCDGDGFRLQPSRLAEGFVLTDAGKARLAELKAKHAAQGQGAR